MARVDYERENNIKNQLEAIKELKAFLKTPEATKHLPNWLYLIEYLDEKDKEIDELKEKLRKYNEFFETLGSFLPDNSPRLLNDKY